MIEICRTSAYNLTELKHTVKLLSHHNYLIFYKQKDRLVETSTHTCINTNTHTDTHTHTNVGLMVQPIK